MLRNKKSRHANNARTRDFSVWIVSLYSANMQGWLEHKATGSCRYFESLLEMVSLIDDKLEDLNIARPETERRSFFKHEDFNEVKVGNREDGTRKPMDKKNGNGKPTGKPEFLVRVLMRQNATWQGEVHWLNSDRIVNFRSLLELILLLQEAMEISGEPRAEYEFRSWEEEKEGAASL